MINIIEIKDVVLNCNNKFIFDNISLDIKKGDFITFMGSNGAGKSRLANVLYGIIPYLGTIKIGNKILDEDNIEEIRSKMNIVFEDSYNLFVTDNVLDELNYCAVSTKDIDFVVKKLNIVNLLNSDINELSGGEKQLISIACALVSRPLILILDESLSSLDNFNKVKVMKLLKQYNKKGMTIINMTQNSEEILYGNRVIIFNNGNIVLNLPTKKALEQERVFISANIMLPFMADLCTKLKYYNIVSKIELNKDRLVNFIWK